MQEVGSTIGDAQHSELEARFDFELVEKLVDQLRPRAVRIFACRATLQHLTEYLENFDPSQPFSQVRDQLYEKCGLDVPKLRLVEDASLKEGAIAVGVNHLPSLPVFMGLPSSILSGLAQQLSVESERILNTRDVGAVINVLARAFPALVENLQATLTTEHVTCALRQMVRDGISIRPLRPILEGMIDRRHVVGSVGSASTSDVLILLRIRRRKRTPVLCFR